MIVEGAGWSEAEEAAADARALHQRLFVMDMHLDSILFTTLYGQIEQQVQRIQRLIDRLLELSKLEQRQSLLVDAPTSLRDCAEAAIAEAQARARQKNVAITLQGDGGSGPFEAALVALAVSNLLDNAIDFSPVGGSVRVDLAGGRISVTDAGPGVPDYALPRLGERFFSTAPTASAPARAWAWPSCARSWRCTTAT